MTKTKIAYFRANDEQKKFFKEKLGQSHDILFFESNDIKKHLDGIGDIDILCVRTNIDVCDKVISKLPKLKLIVTRTTGFDHIDCKFANNKNIQVCNVPNYGSKTVAEHAFAHILHLARNISKFDANAKRGEFTKESLKGFDLNSKTIGIIGGGKIGCNAAKIAKGFDMSVIVTDPFPNKKLAEEIGFRYVELNNLLQNSDIISIHTPLLPATKHLINKENVDNIKKGCIFINTARGAIVSNQALIHALDKSIITKAGLDVIEGEEYFLFGKEGEEIENINNIISRDNVTFTPHVGYYTKEAEQRIWQTTIDNILNFEDGKAQNCINK